MSLKILIVEDEVVIAEDMKMMLENIGYEVSGVAYTYNDAIEILKGGVPDISLIDINLGSKKDGIELADFINKNYFIPFIYATSNIDPRTLENAKQTNPCGYLLKPFAQDDLFTSIEIAIDNFQKRNTFGSVLKEFLFVKEKNTFVKVKTNDILWLKSDGNYTELHTAGKNYVVRGVVKNLLDNLDQRFLRVHKSYVVNIEKVDVIEATHILINKNEIPLGKMYKELLMSRINTFS